MASQAVIFLAHLILFGLVYLLIVTEVVPVLSYLPEYTQPLVYWAPIHAVIALGIYAVVNVIYGVATFNDCREAKEELLREIKAAREDLRQSGIID